MGNCLVTKYKARVDDNNLPKLGEFLINVTNGTYSNKKLTVKGTESLVLRVLGGANRVKCSSLGYDNYVNSITIPANTSAQIEVDTNYAYTIGISKSDKIYQIAVPGANGALSMDFIQLNDLVNVDELGFGASRVSGNLKDLNLSSLRIFSADATQIYGNLSENHINDVTYWVNPTGVVGTTAEILTYVPNVTHFSFEGNADGNMTGSVEEFAEDMLSKGITRNINLAYIKGGITFHGEVVTGSKSIKCVGSAGLITLKIGSDVIATYDGTWTYIQ